MLVGIPGIGKTTWRTVGSHPVLQELYNPVVISSDDYIEAVALQKNKTYTEIFLDSIKDATNYVNAAIITNCFYGFDIIHDRTNTTTMSRKKTLDLVDPEYEKIAIVFNHPTPGTEKWEILEQRLSGRPGKTIPKKAIDNMVSNFTKPKKSEGFDEIYEVDISL